MAQRREGQYKAGDEQGDNAPGAAGGAAEAGIAIAGAGCRARAVARASARRQAVHARGAVIVLRDSGLSGAQITQRTHRGTARARGARPTSITDEEGESENNDEAERDKSVP